MGKKDISSVGRLVCCSLGPLHTYISIVNSNWNPQWILIGLIINLFLENSLDGAYFAKGEMPSSNMPFLVEIFCFGHHWHTALKLSTRIYCVCYCCLLLSNNNQHYMWFLQFWSHFRRTTHCLPRRLKSTLFEIFSTLWVPFGHPPFEKISNNVDFSLWGKQYIIPAKMRPKSWKSYIAWSSELTLHNLNVIWSSVS